MTLARIGLSAPSASSTHSPCTGASISLDNSAITGATDDGGVPMPTGCGSDELLAADVDQLGHATVVRPRGEIDMSSVDILQDALRRAVTEGNSDIVIDATELRFCDVRGMEVLDAASAKLANHHRRLVIANPSQSVRRVIRLLDVDRLLAEQDRDLAQP